MTTLVMKNIRAKKDEGKPLKARLTELEKEAFDKAIEGRSQVEALGFILRWFSAQPKLKRLQILGILDDDDDAEEYAVLNKSNEGEQRESERGVGGEGLRAAQRKQHGQSKRKNQK